MNATPDEFENAVFQAGPGLVVIYFWGPQCPNCEIFASHLPALLRELADADVRFVKTDAYSYPELAKRFGLYGIPTFVLVRDGKVLGKMTSFQGGEYFLSVIRERLA